MKHTLRRVMVDTIKSHPAGVRGLKLYMLRIRLAIWRVAPRRGAWIETLEEAQQIARDAGRTPQGCVD